MRLMARSGDDVELHAADALSELHGCRKVRAILGAAQHQCRHRYRGKPRREIHAADRLAARAASRLSLLTASRTRMTAVPASPPTGSP